MNEWKPIAQKLRKLSQMPLVTRDDLASLNICADQLLAELRAMEQSVYDSLPHFIEHYLADADIRLKDCKYCEAQQKQIGEIIKKLETGANQAPQGTTPNVADPGRQRSRTKKGT